MNAHKKCPYCPSEVVAHYWFRHILKQHADRLFDDTTPDGRHNRAALSFSADRKSLPKLKFNNESLYVCLECECAINREKFAEKHNAHLRQSRQRADELQTLFAPSNPETPLSVPEQAVSNQEIVAYQRVILSLVEELEDALYWKAKYDKACEEPDLYEKLKELDDPETISYDLTTECKREAKVVCLDRAKLEAARKVKL